MTPSGTFHAVLASPFSLNILAMTELLPQPGRGPLSPSAPPDVPPPAVTPAPTPTPNMPGAYEAAINRQHKTHPIPQPRQRLPPQLENGCYEAFKRRKVKVACENCRLKKKKCDGAKPVCSACKANYDKRVMARLKAARRQSRSKSAHNTKDVLSDVPMPQCLYRSLEEAAYCGAGTVIQRNDVGFGRRASGPSIESGGNLRPGLYSPVSTPANCAVASNLEVRSAFGPQSPYFLSTTRNYGGGSNNSSSNSGFFNDEFAKAGETLFESGRHPGGSSANPLLLDIRSKFENLTKLVEANNSLFSRYSERESRFGIEDSTESSAGVSIQNSNNTLITTTLEEIALSLRKIEHAVDLDTSASVLFSEVTGSLGKSGSATTSDPSISNSSSSSSGINANNNASDNITNDLMGTDKQYFPGYWDRSVERVLKWPIFDGKYDEVKDIKLIMQSKNSHILHGDRRFNFAHDFLLFGQNKWAVGSESKQANSSYKTSVNASINGSKSQSVIDNDTSSVLRINNIIIGPRESAPAPNGTVDKQQNDHVNSESVKLSDLLGLNFHNLKQLAELEPLIVKNLRTWVDDFILNVHTSGNLFLNITNLRNTANYLVAAYKNFLITENISFKAIDKVTGEIDYDSIDYGGRAISFLLNFSTHQGSPVANANDANEHGNINLESTNGNDYTVHNDNANINSQRVILKEVQQLKHVPIYVMLVVLSTGMLSSRYNPKNSRISNYKSSISEQKNKRKAELAFKLYKLSAQFKSLMNANLIYSAPDHAKAYSGNGSGSEAGKATFGYVNKVSNIEAKEYYSLWNIQYFLVLSLYKNYMLRPLEAWDHIHAASSLIITFLELNKDKFQIKRNHKSFQKAAHKSTTQDMLDNIEEIEDEYYQLIERLYWQSFKNECELKLYLSPIYSSSGIINYKPPFKIGDLQIPKNINQEDPVLKDGWAFYLTEVFVRPILNKIANKFYCKSLNETNYHRTSTNDKTDYSIERNWANLNQEKFVEIIQDFLRETGDLLKIFEKFLNQQKLSTPLRCADERVIRIKECLCLPLLYHISTVVPLPMPNYNSNQLSTRPTNYQMYLHPYIISFLKDLCDQYLRFTDLIEFASERRHGSWFRLRDIYLACMILMIIYKKFGIYFFEKQKLKTYIKQTNTIYEYWQEECPELAYSLEIINSIYDSLPYISD